MSRSPLNLVQDLYRAFGAKDEAALRALLHDDVEWIQCPGFPGGAHRTSADEVLEGVLGGLNEEWDGFAVRIDEYLPGEAHVVVLGEYTGRHRGTGRAMGSLFAHVYEVEAGRIRRFRQVADTWPMVAAIRGEAPGLQT
ncbi:MAG: nuclear transport factor 2 family protein [Planctomycetota bacterium]|nr:nuclear transport factor 2 family protein [Planctomycetota bacterium]